MYKTFMEKPWAFSLCFAVAMVMAMAPDFALAAAGGGSGDTIANVLCTVVGWFTGNVGKGIATLAIIIIGVGALMGKVSWGTEDSEYLTYEPRSTKRKESLIIQAECIAVNV